MSNYIMDLHQIVGRRTILQVGASVILEDEQGRILLELRTDNHCWGYPGGSVELDEIVEDAARRELFEETGLVADSLELFGVFSGKDLHYVYPNGDEVSNVDVVFLCKSYSGTMKCQEAEVERLHFLRRKIFRRIFRRRSENRCMRGLRGSWHNQSKRMKRWSTNADNASCKGGES